MQKILVLGAEIITNQEEDMQKVEKDLERLQCGFNALINVEVYIEQYEIDLVE